MHTHKNTVSIFMSLTRHKYQEEPDKPPLKRLRDRCGGAGCNPCCLERLGQEDRKFKICLSYMSVREGAIILTCNINITGEELEKDTSEGYPSPTDTSPLSRPLTFHRLDKTVILEKKI